MPPSCTGAHPILQSAVKIEGLPPSRVGSNNVRVGCCEERQLDTSQVRWRCWMRPFEPPIQVQLRTPRTAKVPCDSPRSPENQDCFGREFRRTAVLGCDARGNVTMSLREQQMTTSGARPGKTRCRHERVVRSIQDGTNDDRRHGELGRLASRMTLMSAAAGEECDLADAPGQATCSPSLSSRS